MLAVKYDIPKTQPAMLADGTTVDVTWSLADGFAARVGRQRFTAPRLTDLVRKIDRHREQDRDSAARARAVRATKPLPAITFPGFEEVGVRGVHAQSGYALITTGDGVSGTPMPFSQLLRPLDDAELTKIRTAYQEAANAQMALDQSPLLRRWDAETMIDATITVEYVADVTNGERFVAKTDGIEVASSSASYAVAQATDLLYRKRWPFAFVHGDGDPHIVSGEEYDGPDYGRDGLFATLDEASNHLRLVHDVQARQEDVVRLLNEYAFDATRFRGETTP